MGFVQVSYIFDNSGVLGKFALLKLWRYVAIESVLFGINALPVKCFQNNFLLLTSAAYIYTKYNKKQ